jgi:hypothetical protein
MKLVGKVMPMMGSKERHFAPLIHVSLEELVPHDHFYRHLERSLDLSFVREFVQENSTSMGPRCKPTHHTHYVVDGGKTRIILGVLVTPSEVMDNQPMRDLIWRTCFRWKLRPRHVTGDTKYGTTDNIVALD